MIKSLNTDAQGIQQSKTQHNRVRVSQHSIRAARELNRSFTIFLIESNSGRVEFEYNYLLIFN